MKDVKVEKKNVKNKSNVKKNKTLSANARRIAIAILLAKDEDLDQLSLPFND